MAAERAVAGLTRAFVALSQAAGHQAAVCQGLIGTAAQDEALREGDVAMDKVTDNFQTLQVLFPPTLPGNAVVGGKGQGVKRRRDAAEAPVSQAATEPPILQSSAPQAPPPAPEEVATGPQQQAARKRAGDGHLSGAPAGTSLQVLTQDELNMALVQVGQFPPQIVQASKGLCAVLGVSQGALVNCPLAALVGMTVPGGASHTLVTAMQEQRPAWVMCQLSMGTGAVLPVALLTCPIDPPSSRALLVVRQVSDSVVSWWLGQRAAGSLPAPASVPVALAHFRHAAAMFPATSPSTTSSREFSGLASTSSGEQSTLSHGSGSALVPAAAQVLAPGPKRFRLAATKAPAPPASTLQRQVELQTGPVFAAATFPVDHGHRPRWGRKGTGGVGPAAHPTPPAAASAGGDDVPVAVGGVGTNFKIPLRERDSESSTAGGATGSSSAPSGMHASGPRSSASAALGPVGEGFVPRGLQMGDSAHMAQGGFGGVEHVELAPVLAALHPTHGGRAHWETEGTHSPAQGAGGSHIT